MFSSLFRSLLKFKNIYITIRLKLTMIPYLETGRDLETECLKVLAEKHNCTPLFYYRYVDDTIL